MCPKLVVIKQSKGFINVLSYFTVWIRVLLSPKCSLPCGGFGFRRRPIGERVTQTAPKIEAQHLSDWVFFPDFFANAPILCEK